MGARDGFARSITNIINNIKQQNTLRDAEPEDIMAFRQGLTATCTIICFQLSGML